MPRAVQSGAELLLSLSQPDGAVCGLPVPAPRLQSLISFCLGDARALCGEGTGDKRAFRSGVVDLC